MNRPLKLGFAASRNGSSARAIIEAIAAGALDAEARLMVSNNRTAAALVFAETHAVATECIPTQADPEAADRRFRQAMQDAGVDLIVLSGYLRRLGPETLNAFAGRILNIHPGPLPDFGGHGMYGRSVHEAVLAAGVPASGIALHVVDGDYDTGPVMAQRRVEILPGDTVETLEARVTALEPAFFVETLQRIGRGDLVLPA